jgi:Peptidase family M23
VRRFLTVWATLAAVVAGCAALATAGSGRAFGTVSSAPQASSCVGSSVSRAAASASVLSLGTSRMSLRPLIQRRYFAGPFPHRRWSYDWPVKPFDEPHPIRGFFNDPRYGDHGSRAFHFGVDVAAPDGTPVYAAQAGRVDREAGRAVGVTARNGRSLGYWHIVPVVRDGQFVGRHQLLGYVQTGWGHVHLAERIAGVYVNPLRPGGLGPYHDRVPPTIDELDVLPSRPGTVDVVVSAFDRPDPPVGGRWADEPVTPALIRWRLVKDGRPVPRWRRAVDFRWRLLARRRFPSVYAPGTRENHEAEPGRYCFYVVTMSRRLATLRPGGYALQVVATDTRGNAGFATLPLSVDDRARTAP